MPTVVTPIQNAYPVAHTRPIDGVVTIHRTTAIAHTKPIDNAAPLPAMDAVYMSSSKPLRVSSATGVM